jgi:type I restriction enzyme S subunit
MATILRANKKMHIPSDWEFSPIGNLAEIHGGSTPSTEDLGYWKDGNILWATPTDITGLSSKFISDTHRKITKKAVNETALRLCDPGTLIMTSRATIGYPAIADKQITTNQGFINMHCGNKLEVIFFYYWIIQNRTLLERYSQGSTFLELSKKDFRRFHISLPPLAEQRKISEILSTVDEAIEKTNAIIQQTLQLKKGLMQKLFTEGIGHTRFREWDRSNLKGSRVQISAIGRLPESWAVTRIGDLAKNKKGAIKIGPFGSQLRKEEMVKYGVSVYGQENVFNKDFKIGTYFISNEKYEQLKSVTLYPGDIVLTMMGTIGDCCVVPPDINTGIMDSHLMRIQVNESVNPNYFSRLIRESSIVKKQVECLSQGAIMSGLNLSLVKDIYLPIPPIAEQTEIEEILSAVDTRIVTEQSYKAELERLKKGLMQVLLTGQVRVKVKV